jgi:hypothetical protein
VDLLCARRKPGFAGFVDLDLLDLWICYVRAKSLDLLDLWIWICWICGFAMCTPKAWICGFGFVGFVDLLCAPGVNPPIASCNASAVENYNYNYNYNFLLNEIFCVTSLLRTTLL